MDEIELPEKLVGGRWNVEGETFGDDYLRHVLLQIKTNVSFPKTRKADRALQLLKRHGAVYFNQHTRLWEAL